MKPPHDPTNLDELLAKGEARADMRASLDRAVASDTSARGRTTSAIPRAGRIALAIIALIGAGFGGVIAIFWLVFWSVSAWANESTRLSPPSLLAYGGLAVAICLPIVIAIMVYRRPNWVGATWFCVGTIALILGSFLLRP